MATAPKPDTKGPNQLAYENGWGNIAVPLKPFKKSPVWEGWSNPLLKYDPDELGYEPKGFDWSGCGVGIRTGIDIGTGYGVWAFDVDVLDWLLVGEVMKVIRAHLGMDIVTREGNAPKVLVPVRVRMGELDGFKPKPISLGNGHYIELMYAGRQFVVNGIHPDTRKAYKCTPDILDKGPECLIVLSATQVKDLWRALDTQFGVSKDEDEEAPQGTNGNSYSSQALNVDDTLSRLSRGENIHENLTSLTASLVNSGMDADMVRDWLRDKKVLENLPRDTHRVGDLDDDRSEIGRAITGAVTKYGRGSRWEFNHEALKGNVSGHKEAAQEFGVSKVAANDDNPFAVPSEADMEVERLVKRMGASTATVPASSFKLVSTGWEDDPKSLPMTPFLDEGQMLLKGAIMAVQGKPMTGKSTWALTYLLHLMTGVGGAEFGAVLRGYKSDKERAEAGKKLKVLYLSADDPADMVKKRVAAWRVFHKVSNAGLDGRLFTLSVSEGIMGLRLDTPAGLAALRTMVRDNGIDVVMGDPASNLLPQSDGANDEALGAIKGLIGAIADMGVAGLFIWHVRKAANSEGAESSLDDIRGAGAIGGAVRGAKDMRFLNAKEVETYSLDPRQVGDNGEWSYRKLSHTKNSYGRLQEDAWYKLVSVDLLNDGTGLGGDTAGVMVRVDVPGNGKALTDVDITEFLRQLWTAAGAKKHYTDTGKSKDRDVYAMARDQFGWRRGQTNDVLGMLSKAGNIKIGDVQLKGRSANNLVRGISVEDDYWAGKSHTANELTPFDPIL